MCTVAAARQISQSLACIDLHGSFQPGRVYVQTCLACIEGRTGQHRSRKETSVRPWGGGDGETTPFPSCTSLENIPRAKPVRVISKGRVVFGRDRPDSSPSGVRSPGLVFRSRGRYILRVVYLQIPPCVDRRRERPCFIYLACLLLRPVLLSASVWKFWACSCRGGDR
jgi:hypothetical protein